MPTPAPTSNRLNVNIITPLPEIAGIDIQKTHLAFTAALAKKEGSDLAQKKCAEAHAQRDERITGRFLQFPHIKNGCRATSLLVAYLPHMGATLTLAALMGVTWQDVVVGAPNHALKYSALGLSRMYCNFSGGDW